MVNEGKTHLIAGSVVCGGIQRITGPALEKQCREIEGCPTEEVRITQAYDLPCRHVIHTIGPRYWVGTRGESNILLVATSPSFLLRKNTGLRAPQYLQLAQGFIDIPWKKQRRLPLRRRLPYFLEVWGFCRKKKISMGILY